MKKYLLIPAAFVLLALFSFSPAEQWTKYASSDGHFSINFPGKPEESTQDDTTGDGVRFKIHFATYSPSDDIVYMAGWIDFSFMEFKDQTIKDMLEKSKEGALGSMNAKAVSSKIVETGKEPYIEFIFKTDDFTGKDRIYIINKYQYSIITIFSAQKGISPLADKFIASFRHG